MQQEIEYFDFDIEVDTEEDDYKLLLDLPLRNNFKPRVGKSLNEIKYLGVPKFKSIEGKKCLLMEPMSIVRSKNTADPHKTQQQRSNKSNLISIPSYHNIKTKSGRLFLEIFPLDIKTKQYIFIHNEIQYPSTNISIRIDNHRLYLRDINGTQELGIDLIQDKWQELNVDFNGSFYTAPNFYISDIQEGLHAYIRNLRIYKK